MPIKIGWANLTIEQRDALLVLYNALNEDGTRLYSDEILAQITKEKYNVDIKPGTLARRLREYRAAFAVPPKRRIQIVEEDNKLHVSCISERVKTLEQLLKKAEVDTTIWKVLNFKVNSYESFRKRLHKRLVYTKGKADGVVEDVGGVTIVPLFKIEANLIRKVPITVTPLIQPVILNSQPIMGIPKPTKATEILKALVLPDPHICFRRNFNTGALEPFHDRAVLDVALQIAKANSFDVVAFIGDIFDLPCWTDTFIRSPELQQTTQPALIEFKWWLSQFIYAAPNSDIVILEGNHEARIPKMLKKHLPQALNLQRVSNIKIETPVLSIPYLLALDELDIGWVGGWPDNKIWLSDNITLRHGSVVRGRSGKTVQAVINDATETQVFGHIHRFETATKTIYTCNGSRSITAASVGCMCRIDGIVPGKKTEQNWQQGFAVVEYSLEKDNPYYNIINAPFINGRVVYNGHVYLAQNRFEDLQIATPDWRF